MADPTDEPAPAEVCCGRHWRDGKGQPFGHACVLCAHSPTYYRGEAGYQERQKRVEVEGHLPERFDKVLGDRDVAGR